MRQTFAFLALLTFIVSACAPAGETNQSMPIVGVPVQPVVVFENAVQAPAIGIEVEIPQTALPVTSTPEQIVARATQEPTTQVIQTATIKSTPTEEPMNNIAVCIDDDAGWCNIIAFHLQSAGFDEVKKCLSFCDDPNAKAFIVDGEAAEQIVGPGFVKILRDAHSNAIIIGISGRLDMKLHSSISGQEMNLEAAFMEAGANAVIDKGGDILQQIKSLFPNQ